MRLLGALPPARESVRLPSPGVPSLGPAFECVEDDLLPSRRDSLPVPLCSLPVVRAFLHPYTFS